MNMYSVPNSGMPGCPPGLEYLTQVGTGRIQRLIFLSSVSLHFVMFICAIVSMKSLDTFTTLSCLLQ